MLLFLPLGLLLATILALGLIPRLQPGFRSSWLLALVGALASMLAMLALRGRLPLEFSYSGWSFGPGLQFELVWSLDAAAWPIAFALLILLLAALLCSVARASRATAWSWIPGISLVLAALFAVLAADAVSVVLGWGLVDGLLLAFSLAFLRDPVEIRNALRTFPFAVAGTMLLLWVTVQFTVANWHLAAFPARAGVFLVLAAALRLGVLPMTSYTLGEKRDLVLDARFLMTVVPPATTLAFLLRLPHPVQALQAPLLLWFLLVAFIAAFRWFGRRSKLSLRPDYITAFSALALIAATVGQPAALLAWSLALLLGGAYFYLAERQAGSQLLIAIAGLLLLSPLPYTPLYAGAALTHRPGSLWLLLVPGVLAVLIAAWLRHALAAPLAEAVERWVATIRQAGQFLLVLASAALSLGLAPTLKPASPLNWLGLSAAPLAAALFFAARRRDLLPAPLAERFGQVLSLHRFEQPLRQVGRGLVAPLHLFGELLEGRAGVLWALLGIVLLLSLIIQLGPAGL